MMQSMSGVRMGEEVSTWSTLLEESYTPTKQKPWQGIWVGDYSAHGCEFLLVLQKDHMDHSRGRVTRRSSTSSGLPSGVVFIDPDIDDGVEILESSTAEARDQDGIDRNVGDNPSAGTPGRLEAIKLTGDINIPRGQCTWFADDIGDGGLIRIADEEVFQGARIVKSMGHVAQREFKNDRYISSQLIMKDYNTLAQYWEVGTILYFPMISTDDQQVFGHVSFYRRVDIDRLLAT